jgi:hypothetical protein
MPRKHRQDSADPHLEQLVLIDDVQRNGMLTIMENKGLINPLAWSPYLPQTKG